MITLKDRINGQQVEVNLADPNNALFILYRDEKDPIEIKLPADAIYRLMLDLDPWLNGRTYPDDD